MIEERWYFSAIFLKRLSFQNILKKKIWFFVQCNALYFVIDLKKALLDFDDSLLLHPTDFITTLFSYASLNHLIILCLKLNILSSCSSNH